MGLWSTSNTRLPAIQPNRRSSRAQDGLAVAQNHAGQVARGQTGFQFLIGDQGERASGLGQRAFRGLRLAGLQRLPGLVQMSAEATDDFFAAATQFAHRIQESHLRVAGALGAIEQSVVEAAKGHREGIHQREARRWRALAPATANRARNARRCECCWTCARFPALAGDLCRGMDRIGTPRPTCTA